MWQVVAQQVAREAIPEALVAPPPMAPVVAAPTSVADVLQGPLTVEVH